MDPSLLGNYEAKHHEDQDDTEESSAAVHLVMSAKVRPRLFSHTVPGRKSGKGDSRNRLVYQGVDVPTPGVDSRDRTVYPGVDGLIPRVDSRDRPVYQGIDGQNPEIDQPTRG